MTDPNAPPSRDPQSARDRFRATLVRVLTVQVITLIALWLLQSRYA